MSITKVSTDLRAIIDMAERLEARAIDEATRGDRLGSGPLGGEAMVNLASVADMSAWLRRNDLAGDALVSYEDPDELWSSFQTLRFWSEQWRVDLDMDYDDPTWRPSLRSEAAFLRTPDVLNWAWDTEPHWDEFAADVATARRKLEDVLKEGDRVTLSRVACPDCTKRIAQDAQGGSPDDEQGFDGELHRWDSERPADRRTAPRLIAVYGDSDDEDRWKCPECRHRFTAAEVHDAGVAQKRAAGHTQRWLPLADAISILRKEGGWREKTIRTWANNTTEVSSEIRNGIRYVLWPDMWRCHLLHRWLIDERNRMVQERRQHRADCEREHGPDCWVHRRGCSRDRRAV